MRGDSFRGLATEQRHSASKRLDALSVEGILALMDREEPRVARAVAAARVRIARGAKLFERTIRRGGRVFFAGAGTSGRLGVLEAAECPPTFDTPPRLLQAIMAGGPRSVWRSQEGAEDDATDGARQIRRRVRRGDLVVGVSSSGVTPFVHGALREARRRGASTILVTCNRVGVPPRSADVLIAAVVGPEMIAGSTRLKAGTATKLILNRLTVAAMVRLGKVYENLMVDLQPRSDKLRARAVRIIEALTGAKGPEAKRALRAARNRANVAVLMEARRWTRREAERALKQADGRLRDALTRAEG